MIVKALVVGAVLTGFSSIASTTENDVYRYDALGRLVGSCRALPYSAQKTDYGLDAADNRSNLVSASTAFFLSVNEAIYSADGRFRLVLQSDGNLVLYGPSGALWASNTNGSDASVVFFQPDGNVVLYNSSGVGRWGTNSGTHFCANLTIQNDGNLTITAAGGSVVWASNTGGH